MSNIYEQFGRLVERYDNEVEQHIRTINLLADIKAGRVDIDNVTIDGNSWSHTIPAQCPQSCRKDDGTQDSKSDEPAVVPINQPGD